MTNMIASFLDVIRHQKCVETMTPVGLEPTIPGSVGPYPLGHGASPGLLLVMTSRREALHFEDLYLSRETLSTSLVEELCPTVMLVRKLLC